MRVYVDYLHVAVTVKAKPAPEDDWWLRLGLLSEQLGELANTTCSESC